MRVTLKEQIRKIIKNTFLFHEHLEKRSIRKLIEKYSVYGKGVLVDIGCGEKPYESYFKEEGTCYYGTDFPVTSTSKNVDFYSDAHYLPIKSNSCDTVLCTQVIEHVKDFFVVFEEISRILKPGGFLILTAPQEWPLHKEPYDYYRFTSHSLSYLSFYNGFNPELIKNKGGFWMVMGQKLSTHIWKKIKLENPFSYFKYMFISPMVALIQIFSIILDKLDNDDKSTLGYILIAKKVKTK